MLDINSLSDNDGTDKKNIWRVTIQSNDIATIIQDFNGRIPLIVQARDLQCHRDLYGNCEVGNIDSDPSTPARRQVSYHEDGTILGYPWHSKNTQPDEIVYSTINLISALRLKTGAFSYDNPNGDVRDRSHILLFDNSLPKVLWNSH